jgi:hypothetical protein
LYVTRCPTKIQLTIHRSRYHRTLRHVWIYYQRRSLRDDFSRTTSTRNFGCGRITFLLIAIFRRCCLQLPGSPIRGRIGQDGARKLHLWCCGCAFGSLLLVPSLLHMCAFRYTPRTGTNNHPPPIARRPQEARWSASELGAAGFQVQKKELCVVYLHTARS